MRWDPARGMIEAERLSGLDAVVHLAGENIGAGRWTASRKARILESRVIGTRLLCGELARREKPPRVFICASAVGYYGDRGAEVLDEESPPGKGFLADVTRQWEAATGAAERAGMRVVRLRFGMVIGPKGGVLGRLAIPFRLGVGGRLGGGTQYMSWIALDDLARLAVHALADESLSGAVNAVAPETVTNREFTRVLARVLGRPAVLPAPAWALRLALGERADALLLTSARVTPKRALASGFSFLHPELEGALRYALAKPHAGRSSE